MNRLLLKGEAQMMEKWLIEHTTIDPFRARRAVLDSLIWLEAEAWIQKLSLVDTLARCRAKAAKQGWHERQFTGPGGIGSKRTPISPEQARAHPIGRSQKRGENPQFWFIVPPFPVDEADCNACEDCYGCPATCDCMCDVPVWDCLNCGTKRLKEPRFSD